MVGDSAAASRPSARARLAGSPTPRKERLLKLATGASVAIASVLVVIKGIAWIKTGSVAMLGSLLDSVLDSVAAIVNLALVRRAIRPANERYRFGHGKAEPIGGLFQAMIIGGSGVFLFAESVRRFIEPAIPENNALGIAIMVLASLMVGGLVLFQRFVVRETGSLVISGDALHGFGDIAINLSVIVALVISSQFNAPYVDPAIGILLTGILLWGAWGIGATALRQLLDEEFSEDERRQIRQAALEHGDVSDIHDLRTRRAGLNSFIQMHIEMDGAMNLAAAHRIADEVEVSIQLVFPDAEILIHQDPHGAEVVPQYFRT